MRALALVFVTGCMPSVVQSALVETGDMSATYTVTTGHDGTNRAKATFRWVTGEASVLLDDGDRVAIDGMAVGTETDHDEIYGMNVSPAPDHLFELVRGTDAPIGHRVISPQPFTITSMPFTGTYDLEATLTWAPAHVGAKVRITATTTTPGCTTRTLATFVPDTGSFAFTGADVRPSTAMDELPGACSFTLEIFRHEFAEGMTSPLQFVSLNANHFETTTLALH